LCVLQEKTSANKNRPISPGREARYDKIMLLLYAARA